MSVTGFRDPTTAWRDPTPSTNQWLFLVGSGLRGANEGVALLYSTTDFRSFTFVRTVIPARDVPQTQMWECPDLFPVATDSDCGSESVDSNHKHDHQRDWWVFKVSASPTGRDRWWTGTYDVNLTFVPSGTSSWYDFGVFYASKSFLDTSPPQRRATMSDTMNTMDNNNAHSNGNKHAPTRRILWGWIGESDSHASRRGWAGLMSLPRVLTVSSTDGLLHARPVAELHSLRYAAAVVHHVRVATSTPSFILPATARATQMELALDIARYDPDVITGMPPSWYVAVLVSDDAREQTRIGFTQGDEPQVRLCHTFCTTDSSSRACSAYSTLPYLLHAQS